MSGRAVEASGDVDVLLLDKTGTITLGNRAATAFIAAPGVHLKDLANAAQLASLADETPEGRSIVVLAKEKYGIRGRDLSQYEPTFIPFSAQTRMSGANLDGIEVGKVQKTQLRSIAKNMGILFPLRWSMRYQRFRTGAGLRFSFARIGKFLASSRSPTSSKEE